MLPIRFLEIPACGTLNIHPSLLPRYRGAAPVNRCLEAGDTTTGVSLAFTVLACDAGPVLAQQTVKLTGDEQAPELLTELFKKGTDLLMEKLPRVLGGTAATEAVPQDAAAVTRACKMDKAESLLNFASSARVLHNKVRAFAGWPGTVARVKVWQPGKDDLVDMDLKILRSRMATGADVDAEIDAPGPPERNPPQSCAGLFEVWMKEDALCFPCADGSVLEALAVQAAGRKACSAAAFCNSLSRKRLFVDASHIQS
jgi:methionyl-tRNA formyltransferase